MKRTIGFLFRPIREEHQQTQELLALNEMFCLDERWPTPSVKQQMWLSTPGGEDYLKPHFCGTQKAKKLLSYQVAKHFLCFL